MLAFCSTSRIGDAELAVDAHDDLEDVLDQLGRRPSDGSSSSISRGRAIRARLIDSICCSPPDSEPARWSARSLSTGK
jgi:hypothetical protein